MYTKSYKESTKTIRVATDIFSSFGGLSLSPCISQISSIRQALQFLYSIEIAMSTEWGEAYCIQDCYLIFSPFLQSHEFSEDRCGLSL